MKKYFGEIILFLVALCFGSSYIFQTIASFTIGPLYFGLFRSLITAVLLIPFLFKKDGTTNLDLVKIGLIMGVLLFSASICQQSAAGKTESGKLGFISSLYIVLVPLINRVIYKKKINKGVVLSILIATLGLALLCNFVSLDVNPYDLLVLGAAFSYAIEIIYVNRKGAHVDPGKFMCVSSIGAALIYFLFAPIYEVISFEIIRNSIIPLLYLGVFAGAIGYTLQAVGQRMVDDTPASLIMSLESVISVLMGIIFLNEVFTFKELMGCALMFMAIIICVKSSSSG